MQKICHPLNYRTSADYGRVEVVKSTASQSNDLFGSTMNLCAKINSKAPPNGLVIGNGLYETVRHFSFFSKEYSFEKICEYVIKWEHPYSVYSIRSKKKKHSHIVNPFTRLLE
jgi:hypothetical protein